MRKFTTAIIAVFLFSIAAAAQSAPRAEIFGGYSYQRLSFGSGLATNASGWNFAGTIFGNDHFGIVADMDGHYKTYKGASLGLYNFEFGPQVAYHGDSAVSPFARFLIGGTHANAAFAGTSGADTKWNFGFGGGVDVGVSKHFAIRAVQADYIRTHFFSHHQNQLRLSFGVVVKVGGK